MAMKMENSGPDDEVTREQLAVMLNAYCKYKGKYKSVIADFSKYKDKDKISDFAKWGMNWAVGSNVINGSNRIFKPKGKCNACRSCIYAL